MKTLKVTMNFYTVRNIYYSNFQSCLRFGILLWGGDNESIFKLQKKVLQIISVVTTSCRQIFKDYNMLMLSFLYILEVICFI
jgi:hypothetical protein